MSVNAAAREIIDALGLEPLPVEGGFYRVTWRSSDRLAADALPERYQSAKECGGAIYFLVTAEAFSALHRLRSDETYYFHCGDTLELHCLDDKTGASIRLVGLPGTRDCAPQYTVPRGVWQGCRPRPGGQHGYTLVSTSMAPAYDDSDVEFAQRNALIRAFPEAESVIRSLTRSG